MKPNLTTTDQFLLLWLIGSYLIWWAQLYFSYIYLKTRSNFAAANMMLTMFLSTTDTGKSLKEFYKSGFGKMFFVMLYLATAPLLCPVTILLQLFFLIRHIAVFLFIKTAGQMPVDVEPNKYDSSAKSPNELDFETPEN